MEDEGTFPVRTNLGDVEHMGEIESWGYEGDNKDFDCTWVSFIKSNAHRNHLAARAPVDSVQSSNFPTLLLMSQYHERQCTSKQSTVFYSSTTTSRLLVAKAVRSTQRSRLGTTRSRSLWETITRSLSFRQDPLCSRVMTLTEAAKRPIALEAPCVGSTYLDSYFTKNWSSASQHVITTISHTLIGPSHEPSTFTPISGENQGWDRGDYASFPSRDISIPRYLHHLNRYVTDFEPLTYKVAKRLPVMAVICYSWALDLNGNLSTKRSISKAACSFQQSQKNRFRTFSLYSVLAKSHCKAQPADAIVECVKMQRCSRIDPRGHTTARAQHIINPALGVAATLVAHPVTAPTYISENTDSVEKVCTPFRIDLVPRRCCCAKFTDIQFRRSFTYVNRLTQVEFTTATFKGLDDDVAG
ncbi:uncharacterized protein LACBIDRAFT_332116 [Laccaria bicolor S238N-H82]|uniref:Predicted protein n=1 Tax=Laccaria bicolor (strain S238N-H82 / ATCC MYA-4686) TaxID=486041 RepID=B0DRM5_LACBS|nr:uncharacterized protein LACBIDRAFT_332116 [Laccaria bicolor S238N-H82]EDR02810.1 predicted protein [Laccaria bicolor S238N-H82]|eukprot:XP_001886520.1 predicted protein [Laccaria bicolor S238N-H82]